MNGKQSSTLVGVAGFEPAASSSRTKNDSQASGTDIPVTSGFMSQDATPHPIETPAPDASVTHAKLTTELIMSLTEVEVFAVLLGLAADCPEKTADHITRTLAITRKAQQ